MLEITRRNLDRLEQAQKETSPQEEHEEGGLERTDDEYKEWKEWRERDMKRGKERNAKITASRKKEDGCGWKGWNKKSKKGWKLQG